MYSHSLTASILQTSKQPLAPKEAPAAKTMSKTKEENINAFEGMYNLANN
jgi:hypothetical protein